MRLTDIAALLGGSLSGAGDAEIRGVAKIEDAGPGDITFLANPKYAKHLLTTSAVAVLIAEDAQFRELAQRKAPLVLVRVADPYVAFLRLVDRMIPAALPLPPGIHGTAVVAPTARVGPGTAVGAHVVIGERCRIGGNVSLHPGTVIGDDVEIGDRTLLYPNVTVREGCRIGAGVIIHSGTAVGSDGFGFAPLKDGRYEKIPQRGIVVIEDDVEIGANCAIDRATLGETRIKRGAKLDNLIQVAHNVVIGENTVIAAQTGISGSTKLGRNCAVGGQAGFVGHIEVADRSSIGARSGVSKSISEPGKTWFGSPVKEINRALRIEGALRGLPDLLDEIRKLQDRVLRLEELLHNQESGVR